jgi:hypothetical protein
MAMLSLRLASSCIAWETNKSTTTTTTTPVQIANKRSQANPFRLLTSQSVSPLQSVRGRGAGRVVSMSLHMEQQAKGTVRKVLNPPTVVEVRIPPESVAGFEADYERVAASWPEDLAVTTDDLKLEDYVSSAHSLVRRWLPVDLVARLERLIHDPSEPPALVIRGLPIDRELPPTQPNVQVSISML